MSRGQDIQKEDYTIHAKEYNLNHLSKRSNHDIALEYLSEFMKYYKINSLFDVGCGTGRVLNYFRRGNSKIKVKGIEPVKAFIDIAIESGIPKKNIIEGYGDSIPLKDKSFDASCEFGVLHHAEHPEKIIEEMIRISRKAIFLSDVNRFGSGPMVVRVIKLILYKLGLFDIMLFLFRGEKGIKEPRETGWSFLIVFMTLITDFMNGQIGLF